MMTMGKVLSRDGRQPISEACVCTSAAAPSWEMDGMGWDGGGQLGADA